MWVPRRSRVKLGLRRTAMGLVLASAVAACAAPTATGRAAPSESAAPPEISATPETNSDLTRPTDGSPKPPPPVSVRGDGTALALEPFSFGFLGGFSDGPQPKVLPDVGRADHLTVSFPLDGWVFHASLRPAGAGELGREQQTTLRANGDGTFTLDPAGRAGSYDVVLEGVGARQGTFATAFHWTTTVDGPLAKPSAVLAVVSTNAAGAVVYFGVSLNIANLARTPKTSAVTVTVSSRGAKPVTLTGTRPAEPRPTMDGSVYWDGPQFSPQEKGGPILRAKDLGTAPFTYDVSLMLDGRTYNAQAVWPRDVIAGNEPEVNLTFTPPLPEIE